MQSHDVIYNILCIYKYNSSSWMTSAVFQEWLFSLNARMSVLNRKIIMFLDQCSSDKLPHTQSLANVKQIATPGPGNYICAEAFLQAPAEISSSKWNILQDMHQICQAWNSCFINTCHGIPVSLTHVDSEDVPEIPEEWLQVSTTLNCREVSFEDFVESDNALAICPSSEDLSGTSDTTYTVEEGTKQESEDESNKSLKMSQTRE
ncbi:hypothetical protein PR048_003761 [Dryococelus australis]|uniref:DDE-1 domain-containing protein n=1 Tax=Dryococelus australis TaxID=614101 RepID=A0ABQ9IPU8_9NEOP|nr:hypothetical protein PR048_003761 [Dryococelus australis]